MTDDNEPAIEANLLLTISGPPGCGASSLSERLATALECPHVSGGEIFRELAEERGLRLNQLQAQAEASNEIDRALDQRLRSIAESWGASNKPFILESRLAGLLAGDRADIRILLDAPEDVRLNRIADRPETEAEMRVREISEAGRYGSYYDVDLEDRELYDLHLNTARWSKDGVFEIVRTAIETYEPAHDEGAFETPTLDL